MQEYHDQGQAQRFLGSRMRKILSFIIMGLFMFSLTSAFEFDNVKYERDTSFDGVKVSDNPLLQDYNPIEIKNAFGLGDILFEGYLLEHDETCGDECNSIMNVRLGQLGVLVDDIKFRTLRRDGSWEDDNVKGYQIFLKTGENPKVVSEYETDCNGGGAFPNGSLKQLCKTIVVGSHIEQVPVWSNYNLGDVVPAGDYQIKINAQKRRTKTVDWVINTNGEWLDEWANWTGSSITTGIEQYYRLDELSGAVIDEVGNFNGVNSGADRGEVGLINKSFNFSGTAEFVNLTENTFGQAQDITVNLWTRIEAIINGDHWFAMGSNVTGDLIYGLQMDALGHVELPLLEDGVGFKGKAVSSQTLNTGEWYMITAVYNGSSGKILQIYINGTRDGTALGTSIAGSNSTMYLGTGILNGAPSGELIDGVIDEVGIWNRALTDAEITELYNGGIGRTWPFAQGTVTLNSPTPTVVFSNPVVTFNASALIFDGDTIVNMTLFTNETGAFASRNSTALTGTNNSTTWSRTFVDGSHLWNVQTCDSNGDCGFAISNFTFGVDSASPQINISAPSGTLDTNTIGLSETLNVTIDDPNLDSCWYNYNGTNVTIAGCRSTIINTTQFTLIDGDLNITVYANDTGGNINSSTINWSYFVLVNSQTFNANTTEGSTETFTLNYTTAELPTSANLIYDSNISSATIDISNYPIIIVTESVIIPSVGSEINLSFFWNIVSLSSDLNTTSTNQTVNTVGLDNCSVFTFVLFNYTVVDETTQSVLDGNGENVSVQLDLSLYTADKSTLIFNLSTDYNNTNPNAVCSETDLFNGTTYVMDSTVKYSSGSRAIEYYNIRDLTINNASSTQNITLFDIKTSEATDFQITFKNSNFVVVSDALIQVNRQYVAEGVFKTVELPITDSNGQAVVHLVQNDIVYNYIVTKNNVVIGTFNNLVAFCEDATIGQCFISLNANTGTQSAFSPDVGTGISFLPLSFNGTTRDIDFTFTTNDGSVRTVVMSAIKMDQIGNTSVCSSSLTSSSGTITCNVASSVGNETIIVTVTVDGVIAFTSYFSASNDLSLGAGGLFLLLFMVVSIVLMFSESKSMMVFGIMMGFIAGSFMFILEGGIIGGGTAVMWLIIQGVILIWKLNTEGQT